MDMNSSLALPNGYEGDVLELIRVSTAEQAAGDKGGVERQHLANVAAAERHRVRIRRTITVVDVSGRHVMHDPQFKKIFSEMASGDPTLKGLLAAEQSRVIRPEAYGDYAVFEHFAANKKLIYTPDKRIDPNTSEGKMLLLFGGYMSGEELRLIRQRMNDGKQVKRLAGKHAGGNHMLPKGVVYTRQRDPQTGKTTSAHWAHTDFAQNIAQAFEHILHGDSCELAAEKIGGITGKGLHDSLQNPIWIGKRIYRWTVGEEYLPEPSAKNPEPKIRKKTAKREQPLLVDIDLAPIVSEAVFYRVQEILATRRAAWRRGKDKNAGRPRFIGNSMVRCSCGELLYGVYGSRTNENDMYRCKTRHKGGIGCGMPSIRRTGLDAAIIEMVTSQLLNAAFIVEVCNVVLASTRKADPNRGAREKAAAKLASGRQSLIAAMGSGDLSHAEFKVAMAALENKTKAVLATLPQQVKGIQPEQVAEALVTAFGQFAFLGFKEQREALRGGVKEITLSGSTIVSVKLNGGYLAKLSAGAKAALPLKSQLDFCATPDLTITFAQPIEISGVVQ